MAWILFGLAVIALVAQYLAHKGDTGRIAEVHTQTVSELNQKMQELTQRNQLLHTEISELAQFRDIRDAVAEAKSIREAAESTLRAAQTEAQAQRAAAFEEALKIRHEAQLAADALRKDAQANNAEAKNNCNRLVTEANERATRLITHAEHRANEIAGNAYRALNEAEQIERTATAMRNVIEGYGDRYLVPTYSLLDQLAESYGFDDAGRELKQARATSLSLINAYRATSCDYVERTRRETANRFVLDAFNGKVDTILARVKSDNAGTLEQQVRDAYALVNHNGQAFRGARITPEYLASRLEELKWAAAVVALREREKEEQRRIRDQMREEERARREIERALRDAAKEEEALQRAMAKVQDQVAKANDEQKAFFYAQLDELRNKLAEAEAKNQRALSMAQQTKAGHVYVISNVGSFGEQVFKVGMTRRLEPNDRIRELGDASVPFPFDIHAMIWAEDAPALEHALHKRFLDAQVNKVNPRKEFFRIPLEYLKRTVEEQGLQVSWTLAAEASQYRETLAINRALAERSEEAQAWIRSQMAIPEEHLAMEDDAV